MKDNTIHHKRKGKIIKAIVLIAGSLLILMSFLPFLPYLFE